MNQYYYELATLVYDHYRIDPYEQIIFKNRYLTVQDYLLTVSIDDKIKNILALLKMLPDEKEVMMFIRSAISHIIQESFFEQDIHSKYRIKEIRS